MGWANQITIGRGVCTLLVWALIAVGSAYPSDGLWLATLLLFAFSAITDVVDGMVARRLGEVSVLGRILDPLVDKFLTVGSMVLLLGVPGAQSVLPAWMVALMLGRELLVTTLRSGVEARGGNFQAVPIGKYKMAVQCVAVGAVITLPLHWGLVHDPLPFLPGAGSATGSWSPARLFVWAALLITIYSGLIYVFRALAMLREPEDADPGA